MKMIIIGAGIAGTMAYNYFRKYSPVVYEMKATRAAFVDSGAVIRMKDPAIGYLFGTKVKEAEIEKWIWDDGKYYDKCNPHFACTYSNKVSMSITSRSIEHLGKVKRYFINADLNIPEKRIKYGRRFSGISQTKKNTASFFNMKTSLYEEIEYDICINTTPLNNIIPMTCFDFQGVSQSIFRSLNIFTKKMFFYKTYVDKYYTVYIPSEDFEIYRVNLNPEGVVVEGVGMFNTEQCENLLYQLFGIYPNAFNVRKTTECLPIEEKKIVNIDQDLRKRILYQLTSRHNIYSLGRYAIWKNIGVDDIMQDIKRIDQMSSVQSDVLNYDIHGGKI